MMRRVLMGGALALAACAHSGGAKECDPTTDQCACGPGQPDCPAGSTCDTGSSLCIENPDAAPPIDAPPDGPPDAMLAGFGQPCTDKAQCASNLCILVGSGGVCTVACGTCPDGWGCFDVTQQNGEILSECVPITSQLCTQCAQDTECAQIGMDKCITEDTGRSYCARDCTNISCPTGYDCNKVTLGGTDYHECEPHSGACDCNTAGQSGATDPCTISTTFGTTCNGTSTCAGAAGWGACQPPSQTDDPDGSYTDDNCDGIDGDITKGIFVAAAGTDSASCGLVHTMPCATISFGIIRAVQAGKQNVFVQAGTYNEVVVLLSGVNVWGGYDFNWQRGPYSSPGHTVTIVGGKDTSTGGDGEYLAVRAHNLIVPVTMGDLIIQGPQAQGTGGSSGLDGRASYGVHVNGATLTLVRVQIKGGNGAPGATGGAGADAVIVDAQSYMNGGKGGDGARYSTTCDDSSRGGPGPRGTNSCTQSPSSRAMNGGGGGQGGTMDSDCSCCSFDFNARGGDGGGYADYIFGGFGTPGGGGSGGGTCGPAGGGNPGVIVNGAGGSTNSGGYVIGNGYWYARTGNNGGTGENGSGGGGGGGAGGCDNGTDSYGGGGGGGGAGGCAARGGGSGGGGGGGSFALFASGNSNVTITSCDIERGNGGTGGTGGAGGRGQSGGGQGPPGAQQSNGSSPGTGGAGAHGGHGGGGGGGQGGRSVGVGWTPGTTVNQSCTFNGGVQGFGGGGGPSAPSAPAAERDGNSGATGNGGSIEDVRACNSTGDC